MDFRCCPRLSRYTGPRIVYLATSVSPEFSLVSGSARFEVRRLVSAAARPVCRSTGVDAMKSFALSAGLVVGLTVRLSAVALAADATATWDNTTNNWNSAHWSTVNFPNNGNGGVATYDA